MPRFDKTGPEGQGPLTGRGLGPCSAGLRRGFGFRGASPIIPEQVVLTKEEEKQILQEELKQMKSEIQEVEKRLKELK